jgi:hypothetical protein
VVAVTQRQMDTATAMRAWHRNAPRVIWFRPNGKFSRSRVMNAPINRVMGANVLQCSNIRSGSKAGIVRCQAAPKADIGTQSWIVRFVHGHGDSYSITLKPSAEREEATACCQAVASLSFQSFD